MSTKSRPHAGSLAFYPRKRARKETASFSSFPTIEVKEGEKSKPLNFLAYKAGMTHSLGKDSHDKGVTFGYEVAIASTVLEAPPLKVFGVRVYGKAKKGFYGTAPLMDVFAGNVDKQLLKRMASFKKKHKKKAKAGEKEKKAKEEKTGKEEKKKAGFEDLEKAKEKILSVRLLCHTQPGKTKMGKKKPDICEIGVSGNVEQQLALAKEKLGQEIAIAEVVDQNQFIDIKAVTKGKGMQGPVKRAGIKVHRPKAKKRRIVGSISPWNPSTVMWQVARPGHMGYHNRTEVNKKVLKVGTQKEISFVNPKGGFKNYGVLQNDYLIVAGSVAGPSKRVINIRQPIRVKSFESHKIESLDYVAGSNIEPTVELDEEIKVEHVVEKKEEKKEKKSVADEIAAAAKGDQKREKPKGN